MMTDKRKLGIYIHVPFCRSKCLYCDFCSRPTRDAERISRYVERLCEDIANYKTGVDYAPADTVYFGGGTPTLMTGEQFCRILEAVRDRFGLDPDAEITSECNPKTVDIEKLSAMRACGVNRLSIGMQSALDGELRALGRAHKFADTVKTVDIARQVGFDNISLDIMYGIPNQTAASLDKTLSEAILLSPEHLSLYALKIEEGTPFFDMRKSLALPCDDEVAEMYEKICDTLAAHEYNRYEISNFARNGYESRHNLKYWQYDDYIGFGCAAHSFTGGRRIEHSYDVDGYLLGEDITCGSTDIPSCEQMNEYIMLAMRLSRGVDIEAFERRFNCDFSTFGEKFKKFSPEFIALDKRSCAFTDKGFFVSNYILSEVLEF